MPRTSYLLSPEQRAYLHAISVKASRVKKQIDRSDQGREELQQMIVTAKEMSIPYTRIAKVAKLSPERLSQIVKERTDG